MLPAFKQRLREKEEFLHKNEREAGESWEEVYFGCRCLLQRTILQAYSE